MSMGLMEHITEHFSESGLCQCPCDECTLPLSQFCICLDCPCESDADHGAVVPDA